MTPNTPHDVNQSVLYKQPGYPVLQNRLYRTAADSLSCPTGDVVLAQNMSTGLVANIAFRPELVTYDEHYNNEQGASASFRAHLENVSQVIQRTLGRKRLVEVGCGKGLFLELLDRKGCDITGFDPSYDGTSTKIRRCLFRHGLYHAANGLILRHVLEHIADPVSFLVDLANANGDSGLIYIEVPCFNWICQRRAWFDIFYEHVNYFRLNDFYRMFGRLVEAGPTFGGQYIYVVADLASVRRPSRSPEDVAQIPNEFVSSMSRVPGNAPVIIWGGGSKGVIYALMVKRFGGTVDCAIDVNVAKQGMYFPVTGVPVVSPEEALDHLPAGSVIHVMNGNYLDEIREIVGPAYRLLSIDGTTLP